MKTCPCKECKKRNATCHGGCEDYLQWSDEIPRSKTIIVFLPKDKEKRK